MEPNTLTIKDKTIIFDRKIGYVEERQGITFVLVETTSNLIFPQFNLKADKYRNILSFDENGNHMWTIEQAPLITAIDVNGPYSSLFFENGKLCAYHTSGYYYFIDEASGRIKPRDNAKPW